MLSCRAPVEVAMRQPVSHVSSDEDVGACRAGRRRPPAVRGSRCSRLPVQGAAGSADRLIEVKASPLPRLRSSGDHSGRLPFPAERSIGHDGCPAAADASSTPRP